MLSPDYQSRIDAVKQRAQGHWTDILAGLGVDAAILQKRNRPCPLCGGTDRFQYTDKFGQGNYHCRKCGAGDGFNLLQAVTSKDFHTLLVDVEHYLRLSPADAANSAAAPSPERMKQLARRLWQEARPVQAGDEVDRYLQGRRLELAVYPPVLRCHPALAYYEKDQAGKSRKVAEYPALLACVQGADGHGVSVHRTYLHNGAKAPVAEPRKLLTACDGGAVRLFAAAEELAVAEGLETALAVHLATGKPIWMALNAGNLEKLWLPAQVRRVLIYADNDADGDFTGQACAYALARRLRRMSADGTPREVQVFVPKQPGSDWADVWYSKSA
ncbi:DUF7146 domain-containing protein [Pseudomonas sp. 18175]|uniref:DUF7146 domain-containing protein n=1 Tax=Pseudomonas sp. 18175 TaxID=3390056 RepID=UPI003D1C6938